MEKNKTKITLFRILFGIFVIFCANLFIRYGLWISLSHIAWQYDGLPNIYIFGVLTLSAFQLLFSVYKSYETKHFKLIRIIYISAVVFLVLCIMCPFRENEIPFIKWAHLLFGPIGTVLFGAAAFLMIVSNYHTNERHFKRLLIQYSIFLAFCLVLFLIVEAAAIFEMLLTFGIMLVCYSVVLELGRQETVRQEEEAQKQAIDAEEISNVF